MSALEHITPKDASRIIPGIWKTKKSTFLHGSPGIAKSQILLALANNLGVAFIDCRLSQMAPEDIRGIPDLTVVGGVPGLVWIAPSMLPRDLDFSYVVDLLEEETQIAFWNPKSPVNGIHYCRDPKVEVRPINQKHKASFEWIMIEPTEAEIEKAFDDDKPKPVAKRRLDRVTIKLTDENGDLVAGKVRVLVTGLTHAVWVLEEFNSADLNVQAACYELTLDRRQGEYRVPDGVKIVAAGNLDTDKGITFTLPTPIRNRFIHFHMIHDFDDWLEWALLHRIHPQVVGYLSKFKEKLMVFDPQSDEKAFATPRSWETVSDLLYANEDMPIRLLRAMIVGTVGGVGNEFMAYREMVHLLPDIEQIFDGRLTQHTFDSTNKAQLSSAMVTSCCYHLRDEVIKIKRLPDFKKTPEYDKWLLRSDRFIGFMETSVSLDMMIAAFRLASTTYGLPFSTKRMPKLESFAKAHADMILSVRS